MFPFKFRQKILLSFFLKRTRYIHCEGYSHRRYKMQDFTNDLKNLSTNFNLESLIFLIILKYDIGKEGW